MEKNKTALQTLIEWGDKMMEEYPLKVLSFAEAIDKAEELLKLEKQQMKEAWEDGFSFQSPYNNFEEYYNQTYGK